MTRPGGSAGWSTVWIRSPYVDEQKTKRQRRAVRRRIERLEGF